MKRHAVCIFCSTSKLRPSPRLRLRLRVSRRLSGGRGGQELAHGREPRPERVQKIRGEHPRRLSLPRRPRRTPLPAPRVVLRRVRATGRRPRRGPKPRRWRRRGIRPQSARLRRRRRRHRRGRGRLLRLVSVRVPIPSRRFVPGAEARERPRVRVLVSISVKTRVFVDGERGGDARRREASLEGVRARAPLARLRARSRGGSRAVPRGRLEAFFRQSPRVF